MTSASFPLAVVLRGVDNLSGPLGKAEAGLGRLGKKARRVGRTLTTNLTLPTLAIGAAVLTAAANFESGMLNVQALSGATGESMAALEQQARTLGATTAHSASAAAAGQGELALAGFKANEILAATPTILNLASAANIELGQAANIAAGVLKGQRFEAEETQRVTDVLTATFTRSANTLEDLSFAFADAGPVAAGMGIEFEELAATLGLLGDNMFRGSRGGTAIRGALAKLAAPSRQAVETLASLKIKREDLLDSEGNVLSLVNTVRKLEQAGAQTGQLLQIFGQRAGPAMAALVGTGADAIEDLQAKLGTSSEGVGRTAEIADIRMQGAAGAMKGLQSAAEGLALSVADSGLLEWFTANVKTMTAWVQRLSKANPEILKLGTIVAGVVAVLGPFIIGGGLVASGLAGIASAAGVLLPLLSSAATILVSTVIPAVWSFTAALIANPVGLTIVAIVALGAGLIALVKNWDKVVAGAKAVGSAIRNAAGSAIEWLSSKVRALIDVVPDWLVTAFKYSPAGLVIQGAQRLIGGGQEGATATGQPLGASSDRLEAERRGGARGGNDPTVRIEFGDVPPGTHITQDDAEIPVDLALGVSLATG